VNCKLLPHVLSDREFRFFDSLSELSQYDDTYDLTEKSDMHWESLSQQTGAPAKEYLIGKADIPATSGA